MLLLLVAAAVALLKVGVVVPVGIGQEVLQFQLPHTQ
jgi:hypothetical protein